MKNNTGNSKFNLNTKRGMAAAFRNAAKTLDKYGWRQNEMGQQSRGFCAMGALNHLLGTEFTGEYLAKFAWARVSKDGLISKVMGDTVLPNAVESSIIAFNDRAGRTKEQVQRAFRQIANGLEHGGVL